MKLINSLILIILFNSTEIIPQECVGLVSIQVNYENIKIFVNDSLVSKSSTTFEVPFGKHEIKIIKDNEEWGREIIADSIAIVDCGQEISINYVFSENKILKTEPSNVAVYNNEELIGYTPLRLIKNYNKLILNKEGYEDVEINYNEIPESAIQLNFKDLQNEKMFYEKNIFRILIGSALILGGTSAYYKIQADNKFDEYKITGNSQTLKQTRKYDLISGITLSALQVNFGLLIYYFLID